MCENQPNYDRRLRKTGRPIYKASLTLASSFFHGVLQSHRSEINTCIMLSVHSVPSRLDYVVLPRPPSHEEGLVGGWAPRGVVVFLKAFAGDVDTLFSG